MNEVTIKQTLETLNRAALIIAQAGDLETVLQKTADAARMLIQAKYAAIGIPDESGRLKTFVFSGIDKDKVAAMSHLPVGDGVLGAIIRERQTILLDNITQDPRSIGFPKGHPPMISFLGVPIVLAENIVGNLYLADKVGATSFSELDQRLVELMAAHTAVAVNKARLVRERATYGMALTARNEQLTALNDAAIAIASELSLDRVLQKIVDSARELTHADYAALGVPNREGYLSNFVYTGLSPDQAAKIPHMPKGLGLLGAIIEEKRFINIPHIHQDPRSVGFPEGHPPMESFLGLPIFVGDNLVGNLYLTKSQPGDVFSASDQELAAMLATHAAVAIQNARLYEQVGRLAIVEERNRIGMDLHDGIIQSIYAVGLTLESARLALPTQSEEADALLEHAINALNNTIRDIRNFILDLRPRRFQGDLQEGLTRLVREFQANTMVNVELLTPPEVITGISVSAARAFFLTTQESLANIARHAGASQVVLQVTRKGGNGRYTLHFR